ncbi:hypothetical protein [Brevundimonas diminuta]|uniref:hypothetical protein n=1 Tax=Brevundimonas diminuta TaxID=293 RepID=UPI0028B25DC0|nr:hypothetical protein [Brevundimonas diminuta]
MIGRIALIGATVLAAAATSASAQQVQAYFYDTHGRLQATTTAHSNSGSRTLYGLDSADNRTSKATNNAGTRAAPDQLAAGETLLPGQRLVSSDGRFAFVLQEGDGNAVIYGPTGGLWANYATSGRSTIIAMQHDGNVVLRGPANEAVWDTGTAGNPGARLLMQNDGNLVIYVNGWTAVWASGTGGH